VDFDEIKNESHNQNVKKNRATMLGLFALFIIPVILAYTAYFNDWFSAATKNHGELMVEQDVVDIEDFEFTWLGGEVITGKEFETLYWWILPIDQAGCDNACLKLNLHTVNQTYIGLGKESKRINQLLVLAEAPNGFDLGDYPTAIAEYSNTGVKALAKTRSGLNKDLAANYIYLVDPLGNIFMRYPLVSDESKAALTSKSLRTDILRLFKYSRF
jgi:hypothetical protein